MHASCSTGTPSNREACTKLPSRRSSEVSTWQELLLYGNDCSSDTTVRCTVR